MSSRPASSPDKADDTENKDQSSDGPETIEGVLESLKEQRTTLSGLVREIAALRERARLAAEDGEIESVVEAGTLTISFTVGSKDDFEQLLRFYLWDSVVAEPNPPAFDVELTIRCSHSHVDIDKSLEDPDLELPQEM